MDEAIGWRYVIALEILMILELALKAILYKLPVSRILYIVAYFRP